MLSGGWEILRRTLRCLALAFRFLPLVATYPLASRFDRFNELWWTCVLIAIQVR
ncbi:unnamed protein product [Strongylus vulgaris]|uniref:Uncharacterized protein n=1 Tax=Strongylus vulgaris TaxID=40348 RepID=A0A3P7JH77_STRVU|nr:unnamed protein product [Strongylus vulgaris]